MIEMRKKENEGIRREMDRRGKRIWKKKKRDEGQGK